MWDDETAEREVIESVVGDQFREGVRVDIFLAQQFPDRSRAFFQHRLDDGLVFVNGRKCRRSCKVWPGNVVEFAMPDETSGVLVPENIPLDILIEDEDVIVLNKPAGLVVHPAHGNKTGTLVQGLLYHDGKSFGEMIDETQRPGIVHRLDKDTSGVLVVAKNLESRSALKAMFKEQNLEKTYLAIVLGDIEAKSGRIEGAIGRHPTQRKKMAVVREGGKYALTTYRVLECSQGCSFVEVKILTGRTHQIRVHFSSLNHPVLGDSLYGGNPKWSPYPAPRQMLHAWKLDFPHPKHGKPMHCIADLPQDFVAALQSLGFQVPANQATKY